MRLISDWSLVGLQGGGLGLWSFHRRLPLLVDSKFPLVQACFVGAVHVPSVLEFPLVQACLVGAVHVPSALGGG